MSHIEAEDPHPRRRIPVEDSEMSYVDTAGDGPLASGSRASHVGLNAAAAVEDSRNRRISRCVQLDDGHRWGCPTSVVSQLRGIAP